MSHQGRLRQHAWGMMIVLIIQYILGMATNLFVKFPDSGPIGQMWEYARSQLLIVLHMSVGSLLLIGMIALFIRAAKYKSQIWKIASGVSIPAILLSATAGILFVPSQTNLYSFLMALGFIIALVSIVWGLSTSKNTH